MLQRQRIGLRKTSVGVHKRGKRRRETLLQAAYEMICREYNDERPHSSIGNKPPIEFMKSIGATCHPMT